MAKLWYNVTMEKDVNCNKCQYYYITWDKNYPKGCRYFGFKGKTMPSQMVKEASGEVCKGFLLKKENN
ncbi:MAG: uracil-DNA glycosylase [Acetivibrionales bacterium]